jgi:hypothetical protein
MPPVAERKTPSSKGSSLSQLLPFNENRFDAAMVYLSRVHDRPLTKYEMSKLHVLADVFHTLDYATPVIGGPLATWPNGPVVGPAYDRLEEWCTRYELTGQMPDRFKIEPRGELRLFIPRAEADPDEFSDSEKAAMEKAWQTLIPLMDRGFPGYEDSQRLFHDPGTFLGRAYQWAKQEQRAIDWNDIIDAYDEIHAADHRHIKALMRV